MGRNGGREKTGEKGKERGEGKERKDREEKGLDTKSALSLMLTYVAREFYH